MGTTQRVDEKNGAICLVMFSHYAIMVIKKSQMALFLFSAADSKKPVTLWANYLSGSERSHLALLENAIYYWLLNYH